MARSITLTGLAPVIPNRNYFGVFRQPSPRPFSLCLRILRVPARSALPMKFGIAFRILLTCSALISPCLLGVFFQPLAGQGVGAHPTPGT